MVDPLIARWFRYTAYAEGGSFLLLLGIAMPLKYAASIPGPAAFLGQAHGILFLTYLIALGSIARVEGWSWTRIAFGFVAAVLPFGPFVLEARISASGRSG